MICMIFLYQISHINTQKKKQLEEEARHEPRQLGQGLLRAGSSHIDSQKSDRLIMRTAKDLFGITP